ncbi:hypothetical protein [Kocuria turfanensis]|uniref:Uncharacterized protein n=1 Tax=Kocuria turfanensis TaxID=388357 RepID=A0A512IIM4_9MICC|nr:hypothetical protein [Kocuria turfanensis]GEO97563.1 hypothetical protein KTU01_36860 [Kocuria turfanensis]
MLEGLEQSTQVHDLSHLRPGDFVQARLPGTLLVYEGHVETVVPPQGVLWIRHGAFQERRLIALDEYDMFTAPASSPVLEQPTEY